MRLKLRKKRIIHDHEKTILGIKLAHAKYHKSLRWELLIILLLLIVLRSQKTILDFKDKDLIESKIEFIHNLKSDKSFHMTSSKIKQCNDKIRFQLIYSFPLTLSDKNRYADRFDKLSGNLLTASDIDTVRFIELKQIYLDSLSHIFNQVYRKYKVDSLGAYPEVVAKDNYRTIIKNKLNEFQYNLLEQNIGEVWLYTYLEKRKIPILPELKYSKIDTLLNSLERKQKELEVLDKKNFIKLEYFDEGFGLNFIQLVPIILTMIHVFTVICLLNFVIRYLRNRFKNYDLENNIQTLIDILLYLGISKKLAFWLRLLEMLVVILILPLIVIYESYYLNHSVVWILIIVHLIIFGSAVAFIIREFNKNHLDKRNIF